MKPKKQQMRPVFRALTFYILLFLFCRLILLLFDVYARTQQEAVAEAIVRKHLQSAPSAVLFVSINDADPGNGFIARFNKNTALVRKPSQGTQRNAFGDPWSSYFVDNATGRKGRLISIGGMSWLGPFKVKVGVGHPGYGESFTVVRKLWGWTVTNKEQTWIN